MKNKPTKNNSDELDETELDTEELEAEIEDEIEDESKETVTLNNEELSVSWIEDINQRITKMEKRLQKQVTAQTNSITEHLENLLKPLLQPIKLPEKEVDPKEVETKKKPLLYKKKR